MDIDIEKASQLMFGRAMRLPLLCWIRQRADPSFFITEARKGTGYDQKDVTNELERFTALGMLIKIPRQRLNDRQYFVRSDDSHLWEFVDLALTIWPKRSSGVSAHLTDP